MQITAIATALIAGLSLVSASPVPEAGHDKAPPKPNTQVGGPISIVVAPNIATAVNICTQFGGKYNKQLQQCVIQQNQANNIGNNNGGYQYNDNSGNVRREAEAEADAEAGGPPPKKAPKPTPGTVAIVVAPNTATVAQICAQVGGKFDKQLQQCIGQVNQANNIGSDNYAGQSNSNSGSVGGW
ncbi:hypothetical protein SAICODRAFT_19013 [Saitoella complicata NRRL Y-17804]|uniref:uncharacterized protein n=1 Tax=Saitoella complicata (strain BCRC 22490 / CBS 7301 / JCM 7358 / NBRC 10748 / NRRL Y-17804) TaxID=698492 RepID=UPI0008674AA3|nr:uncharacterized protein SAICODRAFT_19013 [Saitoella complicata NRRL Y-17804]ODQ53079.1 hypothetical protein SAICODRAFT_19013 [Saitoella complicata NRRL Y-17804]